MDKQQDQKIRTDIRQGMAAQDHAHARVVTLIELLNRAGQVQVDDSPADTTWQTATVEGAPGNEVVRFAWSDNHHGFSVVLTEGGIAGGEWTGGSFFCEDAEGADTQISLFETVPLVPPGHVADRAVPEARTALAARLAAAFPAFLDDGAVNGADLVDWINQELGAELAALRR
ncbi:hypothetical protein [Paraburkholderia adhaesiva]|uniref:hypothetical protein n=1 Tax=Paraburkholderia adhaesiva TaxID=2883244 RepID=UPI001F480A43|nr:hypothetical protein [Paraburkholderia adhaesiva]